MTKVTLKWQPNSNHNKQYDEVVELTEEEVSIKASVNEAVWSIVNAVPKSAFAIEHTTRIAVALTLENCIDELEIIKAFINEPFKEFFDKIFEYNTLTERLTLTRKAKQRFQEEVYENIKQTDLQKLQGDVTFLCAIISGTAKEIEESGFYINLLRTIFSREQEEADSRALEDTYQQNLAELKSLRKQMIKEKQEGERRLQEVRQTIWSMKNTYEDLVAQGQREFRYLDSWENSCQQQNSAILTKNENTLNECIKNYKIKLDLESRIHGEIENFILENTEDLQNSILYWMQQYDLEIERQDAEIIKLRMTWEAMSEDHINLQKLYEEHRIAIEEWLAYKEEKRRLEALRQLRMVSALLIQRWWRTKLVIRKIGPYDQKKAKRKGTGKGKGKGKDKGKKK